MKKFFVTTSCAFVAVSVMACAPAQEAKNTSHADENTSTAIQLANPFADFKTLEEATQESGFDMVLPRDMPKGYTATHYRALVNGQKMIEVIYENNAHEIRIRKGRTPNNSGVFDEFPETFIKEIQKVPVTLKGRDGRVYVAEWNDAGFSYSISASTDSNAQDDTTASGLSVRTMSGLIGEIVAPAQAQ